MEKQALYFGFGNGGHFLRLPDGRSTLDPSEVAGFPWTIDLLDTGLLRNRKVPDDPDGRVQVVGGGRPDFWFAFVWWDRSGDKRGASNSGFYVRGFGAPVRETFDAIARIAFNYACKQWPEVIARQLFPLTIVDAMAESDGRTSP